MIGDALALEANVAHLDAEHLEVIGVVHLADAAGSGEERLGRDAAAVDAGAADDAALDDGSLEAALHGVERGAVAADARADDDEIVVVIVRGDLHGHGAVVGFRGDAGATAMAGEKRGRGQSRGAGGGIPRETKVYPVGSRKVRGRSGPHRGGCDRFAGSVDASPMRDDPHDGSGAGIGPVSDPRIGRTRADATQPVTVVIALLLTERQHAGRRRSCGNRRGRPGRRGRRRPWCKTWWTSCLNRKRLRWGYRRPGWGFAAGYL